MNAGTVHHPQKEGFALRGIALLVLLLAGGCDPQREDAGAYAVRDSAGIAIVENHAPVWTDGDEWQVRREPVLTIGGGDEEPYQLYGVSSVTRLSDGRIAVALASAGVVRLFGCDGRYLQSLGGLGHGPGEFQRAHRLIERPEGDLWIWDGYRGRMTVFTPTGEYKDSFAVPGGSTWSGGSLRGVSRDGDMFFLFIPMSLSPRDVDTLVRREPFVMARFRPESGAVDTLSVLDGREYFYYQGPEGGRMRRRLIFGRTSAVALGSTSIVTGDTDEFELRVLTHSGAVERIVRRDAGGRAVTARDVQRVRSRLLAAAESVANPSLSRNRTGIAREVPAHSSLPAFEDLLIDSEDNLWVTPFRFPWQEERSWHVLDSDGRWLGEVELPRELAVDRRMEVEQIDSDVVVAVVYDELDVPYVTVHPLMKGDDTASAPVSSCPAPSAAGT